MQENGPKNSMYWQYVLFFYSFLLFVACVCTSRDYYAILGIERDATDRTIKKAYHKLALKNHPDKVADDEKDAAAKKFADIANAYEILSDSEKRRIYDQYGEEGLQASAAGGTPGASAFGAQEETVYFFQGEFGTPLQLSLQRNVDFEETQSVCIWPDLLLDLIWHDPLPEPSFSPLNSGLFVEMSRCPKHI